MSVLARRAAILSVSRLANYGLMLLSPIVLVRLLPVEEFGRYREFVLYASLLQSFAAFSIADSLLYFVPANPRSPWRVVRQTVLLTGVSSVVVVGSLVVIDLALGGAVVGDWRWPLALYTLLFVNLDFWEAFWVATHRPLPVFLYSGARLLARMIVVIVTAAAGGSVEAIVSALIAFEALRFVAAAVAWRWLDRGRDEPPLHEPWRAQWRFCVPSGFSVLLSMGNRNLGNLAVARVLGPAALAQFTIGTYGEPIVLAIRNSISAVVLPEMVSRARGVARDGLDLWRRSTLVNAILLLPLAVLAFRFAEPLVTTVFGPEYLVAAFVLQIYAFVLVRECFDFAPPLRAVNAPSAIVRSNVLALVASGIALVVLLPVAGVRGAIAALAVSAVVDALYLGSQVCRYYGVRLRELVPWSRFARIALAALLATPVIWSSRWTEALGFVGVVLGSFAYLALYLLLLGALRVAEAGAFLGGLRRRLDAA